MNRHDGVFHFRYWTSKTDHYTKSYPDFSLGGDSNSGTQFIYRKLPYYFSKYKLPSPSAPPAS